MNYEYELFLELTETLLKNKKREAFLPIAVTSLVFSKSIDYSWYIEWVVLNKNKLLDLNMSWYVNIGLTQAVNLIINPFSEEYRKYLLEVNNIVKDINIYEE